MEYAVRLLHSEQVILGTELYSGSSILIALTSARRKKQATDARSSALSDVIRHAYLVQTRQAASVAALVTAVLLMQRTGVSPLPAPATTIEATTESPDPDSAQRISIAGPPALVVDWSESHGGYSYEYRTFYWIEDSAIREGPCFVMSYSNTAARADAERWEWEATLAVGRSGAVDIRYQVVARGDRAPHTLPPLHISADRIRTEVSTGECIGPSDE